MRLSQENIEKLCMTGIYRCEPVLDWIESFRRDNPYHCINWTFKVHKYSDGTYAMWDTYWSGSGGLHVKLSDDNFDKFELLFDKDDVHKVNQDEWYDYNEEDRWHVALDSGGYQFSKYWLVRNGAKKNKSAQLERLTRELESLKCEVKWKEEEIERVMKE